MSDIFVNGRALKLSVDDFERQQQSDDASSTKYIILQLLDNLTNHQKLELDSLDVKYQERMAEKTYLFQYAGHDLDRIRAIPFVRSANAYERSPKTSAHLRDVARQEDGESSIRVNVRLHKESDFSSEERASQFLSQGIDEEDDVRGFSESNSVRVAVNAHSITELERLDDANRIKEIENMGLNSDRWHARRQSCYCRELGIMLAIGEKVSKGVKSSEDNVEWLVQRVSAHEQEARRWRRLNRKL
ncbi:uncharacterized protein NECHADRAFT_87742 [Fusarium vanettenii 77-13-4]|uniref:Uncharacterized protein n=1 Tax=Fusarium vanettenii (strain ATCC MYA-4622 / CBS 123669 / FGSC 9596 / NRRL 45880 / 77-13-4) TaxID=660122 RepID=C7Z2W7_FUSV7|nr:uncharacterized protein NECHADRAFT_87742 [Fusarium vanettenii 77-13-4]EEU41554.1 predicted protein [Fusarium vanettenii 77-13-4]